MYYETPRHPWEVFKSRIVLVWKLFGSTTHNDSQLWSGMVDFFFFLKNKNKKVILYISIRFEIIEREIYTEKGKEGEVGWKRGS